EHRNEPPLREELRRRDVLIPITGLPEPRLDRIEREPADRVAGNAADDRSERRDEREPPAAARRRERHRREHHVGRNGEERRFAEAQRREIARRMRMPRQPENAIVSRRKYPHASVPSSIGTKLTGAIVFRRNSSPSRVTLIRYCRPRPPTGITILP